MHFQRTPVGLAHASVVVLRGICVLGAMRQLKTSARALGYRWVAVIACRLIVAFAIVAFFMPMLTLIEAVSGGKSR